KAEVRFRNPGLVRALIVYALKAALARDGTRAATTGGSATIAAFRPAPYPFPASGGGLGGGRSWDWRRSPARPNDLRRAFAPLRGGGVGRPGRAALRVGAPPR